MTDFDRRTVLGVIAGATLISTPASLTFAANGRKTTMTTNPQRALIVLTSVAEFPASTGALAGRPTGFYMDEMATPYWALRDAGVGVDFASIQGGKPPADPSSIGEEGQRKPAVQRFLDDTDSVAKLNTSMPIAAATAADYDLIFLPGGHGTMWDFAQSGDLARIVGAMFDAGAIVGAICHGPAGLVTATTADGRPIVEGRRVNAFTDAEERAVELDGVVPFLLESTLRAQGALFEATDNFQSHAVRDGNLVTGQNPSSVGAVAQLLVEALADTRREEAA
ncbi:MAG: type 1 glutamine amidotransferase domain-containing protein [Pseudomonadota bacterium]